MTDGAALPLALSDLVADAASTGAWSTRTVTAGHAFGGDLEAVTVPSALGLARHVLGADAVVVAMGPGVVGTGTPLGTTAIEAARLLDAAAAPGRAPGAVRAGLGRRPPAAPPGACPTTSMTVLGLTHCTPLAAAVPAEVRGDWRACGCVDVAGAPDAAALLDAAGMRVTTMGRTEAEDPVFFRPRWPQACWRDASSGPDAALRAHGRTRRRGGSYPALVAKENGQRQVHEAPPARSRCWSTRSTRCR